MCPIWWHLRTSVKAYLCAGHWAVELSDKIGPWEKFRLHLERDGHVSLGEGDRNFCFILSSVVEYGFILFTVIECYICCLMLFDVEWNKFNLLIKLVGKIVWVLLHAIVV